MQVVLKDISLKTKAHALKAILSPLRSSVEARIQFGLQAGNKSAQNTENMFGFGAIMKLLQQLTDDKETFDIHVLTDLVEIVYVVITNIKTDEALCLQNSSETKQNPAEDLVYDLLKSKILLQLVTLLQKTPSAVYEDAAESESDPDLSEFDETFTQNKAESNESSKSTTEQHESKIEFLWLRFWRHIILALTAFNNFDQTAQLEVAKGDTIFKRISNFLNLNAGVSKESTAFEKLSVTDKILVRSRGFLRKNFWLSILQSIKDLCKKSVLHSSKIDDEKDLLFVPKTCKTNQLAIVRADVAEKLIQFGRLKVNFAYVFLTYIQSPELQLSAVECLFYIGANNGEAQMELRDRGAFIPLLSILKKGLNTRENLAAEAEAGDELSNDPQADGKTIISSQFTLDEDELKSIGAHSRAISRKSSLFTGKAKSLSRTVTSKSELNKRTEKSKPVLENLLIREKVVKTIWTLVGDDEDIRRLVAQSIDVRMLIEFLEVS
ncbi:hypothetical protein Ciccas_005382 [Cichlidogyrus casuarinus]|uniref:Uncharacterized protein n=1 Tax=Cichlidogyrus casuarinus TaxID=1844966 RepID=A0ABD2Q8T2_9PLAT